MELTAGEGPEAALTFDLIDCSHAGGCLCPLRSGSGWSQFVGCAGSVRSKRNIAMCESSV